MESKIVQVEIQDNGAIRLTSTGRIIGGLLEEVSYADVPNDREENDR